MYGTAPQPQAGPRGRQIGSNELRLLRPVAISHDHISYTISTFRRGAAPAYTAVSYTWGTDQPTEQILLNSHKFAVRPNLWSCLHYLGRAAGKSGWNHLWVDAICINQEDDSERGKQVRLMDQTYRDAIDVSVWLGLPTLTDYQLAMVPPGVSTKTIEVDPFDWHMSCDDLANRPYWTRFWVIQEFLLARNVQIHCGNTSMHWMHFQDLLLRVTSRAGQTSQQSQDLVLGRPYRTNAGASKAEALVMSRHPDKFPEVLQPLYHLLIEHRRSQCKDPRDRVFALLGLVTLEERRCLEKYFPDYTMSEYQVQVIALAHVCTRLFSLQSYPNDEITPDSRQLFEGLGVSSKAQAERMLYVVKDVDYIGADTKAQILSMMEWRMDTLPGSADGQDAENTSGNDAWGLFYDDDSEYQQGSGRGTTWSRRGLQVIGGLLLLAVALACRSKLDSSRK